jgi:hypothetical protein
MGLIEDENSAAAFVGSKLRVRGEFARLFDFYELAVGRDGFDIYVFARFDLDALRAMAARIAIFWIFAIDGLREGYGETMFAHASGASEDQPLRDAPFPNGAAQQFFYSFVSDKRSKRHFLSRYRFQVRRN